MIGLVPVIAMVFVVAVAGTGAIRGYALARNVMDVPNARSSHAMPTPRGGGLAIVGAFVLGLMLLQPDFLGARAAAALLAPGILVALVGFIDDHRHIAARWRLLAHFSAALLALWCLHGLSPLLLFGALRDLGWGGRVLACVGLVWLLNLYNFMDGIDGVAGMEALTVCLGMVAVHSSEHAVIATSAPAVLLMASTLGFLCWNFPPARIFLGDAGSGFLGITLGILALRDSAVAPEWLWCWLILLGVFIVDATVTLLRRLCRRALVFEAHRSHAYQHAAIRAGQHRGVTLSVAAINLFWLLPIALLVAHGVLDGIVALALAYAPLIMLAVRLDAGAAVC